MNRFIFFLQDNFSHSNWKHGGHKAVKNYLGSGQTAREKNCVELNINVPEVK